MNLGESLLGEFSFISVIRYDLCNSGVTMTDFVDCEVRVRYAETDQMGVAYYANYLVWFEVGRSEFCRKREFSYADLEAM